MEERPPDMTDEEMQVVEGATLTDRQFAQLMESSGEDPSAPPPELTDEEFAVMDETGQLPPPPEMSDDEMERSQVIDRLGGVSSPSLLKAMGEGPVTFGSAANTLSAADEYFDRERGWLESIGYTVGIPQQAMTRQFVNFMENIGQLKTSEAKAMLSKEELFPSDIVNYYMPESNGALKFTAGLAADILLDPLNFIGIGALTNAGRKAVVGGKSFFNLEKTSTAERMWLKTSEGIENVIRSDGELIKLTDNDTLTNSAQKLADKKIDFEDFLKENKIKGDAAVPLRDQFQKGMTKKSWADEWWDGDRGITLGIAIPFTKNTIAEVTVPWAVTAPAAGLMKSVAMASGLVKNTLQKTEPGQLIYNFANSFSTRTGKVLFDTQAYKFRGKLDATRKMFNDWEVKNRAALKTIKDRMGTDEKFSAFIEDIVEEIENAPLSMKEAEDVLAQKAADAGKKLKLTYQGDELLKADLGRRVVDGPVVKDLVTETAEDAARKQRLAQYPEAVELISDIRKMNQDLVSEYKKRNLPFTPLDPVGPGWARRYIKHKTAKEYIEYTNKAKRKGKEIGDAVEYAASRIGKVQKSESARSYRGTAKEINLKSMEELGVKVYVDDPLELTRMRALEMQKVIEAHDLMEEASKYAVKGRHPGPDWIEFKADAEAFGGLVFEDGRTVNSYVPSFYKQALNRGEKIYMPSDVYDRLLFEIGGHNAKGAPYQILQTVEPFWNMFRNNALFGAGYLGQNFIGNMTHLLSNSGLGSIDDLGDATKAYMGYGEYVFKNPDGSTYVMKADDLIQEALEDNVFNAGYSAELSMERVAEGIASNREMNKKLWGPLETLKDVATMWRFNRAIAEKSDQIPKFATYINRRKLGFTRDAAREIADRHFYTFNVGSRNQDIAARAIPFSRFPMKSLEYAMDEIRSGKWNSIRVPIKIQNVLEGAWVEDPMTRAALDQTLPDYKEIQDPIHGPLLPGSREVLIETPWAIKTIAGLLPGANIHPFAQLVSLGLSYHGASDEYKEMKAEDFQKFAFNTAKMMIPVPILNAMEIADINNNTFGGILAEQYAESAPSREDRANSAGERLIHKKDSKTVLFDNAAKFGESLEKSEFWLYDLFFTPVNKPQGTSYAGDRQMGIQGEFIRRKFRQIALGTASMTKTDKNVLMNAIALKRQASNVKQSLEEDAIHNEEMFADYKITSDQLNDSIVEKYPQLKKLLYYEDKLDALSEYYNWILSMEQDPKGLNPWDLLFGMGQSEVTGQPPPYYDVLTGGPEDYSDEQAGGRRTQILLNQAPNKNIKKGDDLSDEDLAPVEEDMGDIYE